VGGNYFDDSNVDDADEATIGKILDPVAGTVIVVANERTALRFLGEFLALSVIDAQVGRTFDSFEVGEVSFMAV
jgi:hypothetical protein